MFSVSLELWNDELQSRKKRKDPFSPDKKKPVVVSDILLWSLCGYNYLPKCSAFRCYFVKLSLRNTQQQSDAYMRSMSTSMIAMWFCFLKKFDVVIISQ